MYSHTDTIAALATPPGESGIAVIRISGDSALDVLRRVLRFPGGRVPDWEHRRLYHGGFFDAAGERVDDVMAAVMIGPETYTGENVVELSCHGGGAVVARVLEVLFGDGVRPAGPGEFTRRAFLNAKMDLIQAEAVADLIHARTELQRVVAERQLEGSLSRRIDALADELLGLIAVMEANIDFIEEGIEVFDAPAAVALVGRQRAEIADLLAGASIARPLQDGFRVVIAGAVNAGKSSLFNRLVGESRAIVTEIAGTTRDVLREMLVIDGVPFVLHDTAGLRGDDEAGANTVEKIGIDRAREAAGRADVVVFVVDGASPRTSPRDLAPVLDALDAARTVVVINKTDLGLAPEWRDWIATRSDRDGVVALSAATGDGLGALRGLLARIVGAAEMVRTARTRAVLNARLSALLTDADMSLAELAALLERRESFELLAVPARSALSYYEEATGRRYHDGLLDVIFSRFCIGK